MCHIRISCVFVLAPKDYSFLAYSLPKYRSFHIFSFDFSFYFSNSCISHSCT